MAGLADVLGSGLGVFGSLFNVNQNRHMADEFRNEGDPERSRLRAITNDPSLYYNSPEAKSLADMLDRRYSSTFGNPSGSGTAQALAADALKRGYGAERDRLFQEGGGDYWNRAYPGARGGQNLANMGVFNSLGTLLKAITSGGGGGPEGLSGDYGMTT